MKAVILAGGRGTRLSEETALRPKPMVEIGGQPILWHIMKIYASHGITEFVICCGYKGFMIKEYFANYFLHTSDVTFDLRENQMHVHRQTAEPWKVTLVDTGGDTLTGGRLKRVAEYIDDTFFFTYGDGLSNVDLNALRQTHATNSALVTLTAVQPPGRYGALRMDGELVREFREKPEGDDAWINGGFFVVSPEALDLIAGDHIAWEKDPLETLATREQLAAYRHPGFWHPMDTLRDKEHLQAIWETGEAPWKIW